MAREIISFAFFGILLSSCSTPKITSLTYQSGGNVNELHVGVPANLNLRVSGLTNRGAILSFGARKKNQFTLLQKKDSIVFISIGEKNSSHFELNALTLHNERRDTLFLKSRNGKRIYDQFIISTLPHPRLPDLKLKMCVNDTSICNTFFRYSNKLRLTGRFSFDQFGSVERQCPSGSLYVKSLKITFGNHPMIEFGSIDVDYQNMSFECDVSYLSRFLKEEAIRFDVYVEYELRYVCGYKINYEVYSFVSYYPVSESH